MSDVTMAPEQDAIAESLLGEPQEQQTAEQTGTEQPEVAQQEPEQVESDQYEQTDETADENWLPSEQQKVFPSEILEKYAPRYGYQPEELQADPRLARVIQEKLNTDIFTRQLQEQLQEMQAMQEAGYQEAEPQQQGPTQQPQVTTEQWLQRLGQTVEQTTDPAVAKAFHSEFLRAFGVPEEEIAKAPPQQALAFTNTASKYMLNLMNTHLDNLMQSRLDSLIDQTYPGFKGMWADRAKGVAWEEVRGSNPEFAKLPAYGTTEFKEIADKIGDQFPWLAEMAGQLRDAGRFHGQDAQRLYRGLAQVMLGQQPDPQLVQQAVATGQRQAQRAAVRRSAGNLGSGQSKAANSRTSSRFQTNDDIFDDETMGIYEREHGRL